jgi:predicted O-methyltransferase YrrM
MTDHRLPEFSEVFEHLYALYEAGGMRILGGFSPYVSEGNASRSTFVASGKTVLSTSGGIAVDEMTFAYGLCERIKPGRILVIGNSYGISTLFFALVNPEATVVAIDKFRTTGLRVTNELLESHRSGVGPAAIAIQASTPEDLVQVVTEHLGGSVDLVFVDAVHENEVQSAEFRVLESLLSPQGVIVFHDVISCALSPSIRQLRSEFAEFSFVVCPRTTTGVAVGFPKTNQLLHSFLGFWASSGQDVADFGELMRLKWGVETAEYFDDAATALSFPPHPQL